MSTFALVSSKFSPTCFIQIQVPEEERSQAQYPYIYNNNNNNKTSSCIAFNAHWPKEFVTRRGDFTKIVVCDILGVTVDQSAFD